jgi:hypothetical protein
VSQHLRIFIWTWSIIFIIVYMSTDNSVSETVLSPSSDEEDTKNSYSARSLGRMLSHPLTWICYHWQSSFGELKAWKANILSSMLFQIHHNKTNWNFSRSLVWLAAAVAWYWVSMASNVSIAPAPDDHWEWRSGGMVTGRRKVKCLEKYFPQSKFIPCKSHAN